MNKIYMDHAATTYVNDEVLAEMMPYFSQIFGNPSSIHSFGREAKKALDEARARVAKAINADPREIFFTSGGSEADNWAIRGSAFQNMDKGKHIITTTIEHHAVLHTCEQLERDGFEVTYLPVDDQGLVSVADVEKAIRPDTILITIMYANNEIGTIQSIAEIGALARDKKVLFHTDAVQAVGSIPVDVVQDKIDLLSMSAHKFYGPKGVGVLYARKGVKLPNLIMGGAQERGHRAGTENIPGIVGMGRAIELAVSDMDKKAAKLTALRDRLIQGILDTIPEVRLNGHPTKRLPNNVNVSVQYIEGEALLLNLDYAGIAGSSGSACTSGSLDPSHVLLAIGLPHEIAHGSLRLSLGARNTEEEIEYTIKTLGQIAEKLRAMSPLFAVKEGGTAHV